VAAQGRKPIIVGNWKLNKTIAEALELVTAIKNAASGVAEVEVGVAPPFTALAAVAKRLEGSRVILAAQNLHFEDKGAFTGEVSAPLLRDAGCTHVIVGHSERRQFFGDEDTLVQKKVHAVLRADLTPILCVGELLAEREAGRTFEVVERQLQIALREVPAEKGRGIVVAYEPVWAIGTGKVATTVQAQEVHEFLRGRLRGIWGAEVADAVRIQYGGSVSPDNVTGLMAQADIDGALVGGASLKPESFIAILKYRR
jgi:triosephosphate isomerase (TIM)